MAHELVMFRKDCFTCNWKLISVKGQPCARCVEMTDMGGKFPLWEAKS